MKKKLMRRFCIWGVYCLCVLLMLIVSGVGGKAEQTAAISANDCYENRIAITFDDGPGKGTTEKLLDGLKERGVKATFFLVGEKIEDNRELVASLELGCFHRGVFRERHGDRPGINCKCASR